MNKLAPSLMFSVTSGALDADIVDILDMNRQQRSSKERHNSGFERRALLGWYEIPKMRCKRI
jgi:hypothetical protein